MDVYITEEDVHEVAACLLCYLGDHMALRTNQQFHIRFFGHQKLLLDNQLPTWSFLPYCRLLLYIVRHFLRQVL